MTASQRRRPRLLHVTTTDISLALLLGPQLKAFEAAGYEVVTASAPGPWVDQLDEMGIEHIALRHATRSMALHHDAAALVELVRLFRRIRPDIVHTHNPKPGIYGRMAGRIARVPLVVNTQHGLYAQPGDRFAKRAAVYALERIAAACSDGELVQNREDLGVLRRLRVPERKLHLLGNGIDLTRFAPAAAPTRSRADLRASWGVTDDDVVVGGVGRLVVEKGMLDVFRAAALLRSSAPQVRVVAVGPSEPGKADAVSPADLAAAKDAGVVLLGTRTDMVELYGAFDLFVLASHREGFPRSAMEAAAMGLPVVASDIRGCREVVDNGSTGLLVPVRDPAALAAALAALANDADRRISMGAKGRLKAQAEFDDRRVIETTLAVYRRPKRYPST